VNGVKKPKQNTGIEVTNPASAEESPKSLWISSMMGGSAVMVPLRDPARSTNADKVMRIHTNLRWKYRA